MKVGLYPLYFPRGKLSGLADIINTFQEKMTTTYDIIWRHMNGASSIAKCAYIGPYKIAMQEVVVQLWWRDKF